MIDYAQIKAANETIKTIDIKGKSYAEVNQRIRAFRMLYPTGFIKTELISSYKAADKNGNEYGICVFKATCGYYEGSTPIVLGTGTAYEKENSSFINQTSYIENCESSAIGRCIATGCALGIDVSVASAEEVQNAIENQKATEEQIAAIKELVSDIPAMLKYYKIKNISDLTAEQAEKIIRKKRGA